MNFNCVCDIGSTNEEHCKSSEPGQTSWQIVPVNCSWRLNVCLSYPDCCCSVWCEWTSLICVCSPPLHCSPSIYSTVLKELQVHSLVSGTWCRLNHSYGSELKLWRSRSYTKMFVAQGNTGRFTCCLIHSTISEMHSMYFSFENQFCRYIIVQV